MSFEITNCDFKLYYMSWFAGMQYVNAYKDCRAILVARREWMNASIR
jgi:hypothetical protein